MLGNIRVLIIILFLSTLSAQSTSQFYHKNPNQVRVGDNIVLSVTMFVSEQIVSGMLFFRSIDQISYQEIPMNYVEGNWEAIIPGRNVIGDGLEYVIILHKRSWGRVSIPSNDNPFDYPLSVTILDKEKAPINNMNNPNIRSKTVSSNYVDADILVLSPEPGSINRPEEIVLAVSLFNANAIDTSNYKLLINGDDFTNQSAIDGSILTLVPNQLSIGPKKVLLYFKTSYGLDVKPIEWSFNVTRGKVDVAESLKYKGNLGFLSTNSTVSDYNLVELENSGRVDAELSWIKARYSYKNNTRESAHLQPLNRETLTLQVTDYLKLEYGDIYPSLSPFLLDGKRVRGRHVHVDLPFLDFQYVYGRLSEQVDYKKGKIDGGFSLLPNETDYGPNGSRIFKFTRTGYTFPQEINALRLSFSVFNFFSGGFHFLRARDNYEDMQQYIDTSERFTFTTQDSLIDSIYIFSNYIDENSSMKFSEFQSLTTLNGDSIFLAEKNWGGVTPKENLVAGFSFETSLDNRNIIFQLAWNYSLTNNNIWNGPLTLDELDIKLDSLKDEKIIDIPLDGVPDPDSYKDLFTINEFMTPFVPIDPITFEKNPFRAIINMPSSALHARLKGSYTRNNILLEYKQIGPQFYTFGNPYMTNNIREFSVKDRLSLLGRRLMFVVGYSSRDNNLTEVVLNPLKTKTIMLNSTLVPGPGAPSLVFNLQIIGKNNGVDSVEVDSLGQFLKDNREDSRAFNTLFSINIPGSVGPISNTIALNFNLITYKDLIETEQKYADKPRKDDYLFQKSDTKTISANLSSRFPFPLRTVISFNKTQILIPMTDEYLNTIKDKISWTSLGLSGSYSLKNNSIRINSALNYMTNGNTDDSIQILGFKIGADWDLLNNIVFSLKSNIRFNRIKENENDGIDNDNNGKIDGKSEIWSTSNSGTVISLNYRF